MGYTLNDKILDIPEAMSIYMNQLVYSEKRKGLDVVTLSLGEAFFDIPQFCINETDFVKGYHYSDSLGIPELREKIVEYYNKNYGSEINDIAQVMISSGSKAIIYMVILAVCNMGDEVLIHEPAWLSYQEQARLANAIPVFAPYDINIREIVGLFTGKTKLLVLNNPNNPAGWIYSKEDLKYLYEECKKRGIFILIDEAYSDFVIADNEFVSMSAIADDLDGVFIVNSLSKNMGMSGWRIGYVISSKKNVEVLLVLNQHIITCAPTILQNYIAQYFDDIVAITMPQVKEVVKKRKRILTCLDENGLKYLPGNSTFYIFVNIGELDVDTLDFCLYLLFKYGIATVPGGAYGRSTDKFIRIGIGAESEERIAEAISVIGMVIRNNLANKEYVQHKLEINNYHRFGE